MCIHNDKSSLADKTVKIISGKYKGSEYRVEDWCENTIWSDSWKRYACVSLRELNNEVFQDL